jgi:hypothetical protein
MWKIVACLHYEIMTREAEERSGDSNDKSWQVSDFARSYYDKPKEREIFDENIVERRMDIAHDHRHHIVKSLFHRYAGEGLIVPKITVIDPVDAERRS